MDLMFSDNTGGLVLMEVKLNFRERLYPGHSQFLRASPFWI